MLTSKKHGRKIWIFNYVTKKGDTTFNPTPITIEMGDKLTQEDATIMFWKLIGQELLEVAEVIEIKNVTWIKANYEAE